MAQKANPIGTRLGLSQLWLQQGVSRGQNERRRISSQDQWIEKIVIEILRAHRIWVSDLIIERINNKISIDNNNNKALVEPLWGFTATNAINIKDKPKPKWKIKVSPKLEIKAKSENNKLVIKHKNEPKPKPKLNTKTKLIARTIFKQSLTYDVTKAEIITVNKALAKKNHNNKNQNKKVSKISRKAKIRSFWLSKKINKVIRANQETDNNISKRKLYRDSKIIKGDTIIRPSEWSRSEETSQILIKGVICVIPITKTKRNLARKIVRQRVTDIIQWKRVIERKIIKAKAKIRVNKDYRTIRKAEIIRKAKGLSAIMRMIGHLIQTIEGYNTKVSYELERIRTPYSNVNMIANWAITALNITRNKQLSADKLMKNIIIKRPILPEWWPAHLSRKKIKNLRKKILNRTYRIRRFKRWKRRFFNNRIWKRRNNNNNKRRRMIRKKIRTKMKLVMRTKNRKNKKLRIRRINKIQSMIKLKKIIYKIRIIRNWRNKIRRILKSRLGKIGLSIFVKHKTRIALRDKYSLNSLRHIKTKIKNKIKNKIKAIIAQKRNVKSKIQIKNIEARDTQHIQNKKLRVVDINRLRNKNSKLEKLWQVNRKSQRPKLKNAVKAWLIKLIRSRKDKNIISRKSMLERLKYQTIRTEEYRQINKERKEIDNKNIVLALKRVNRYSIGFKINRFRKMKQSRKYLLNKLVGLRIKAKTVRLLMKRIKSIGKKIRWKKRRLNHKSKTYNLSKQAYMSANLQTINTNKVQRQQYTKKNK